ncbi:MAG: tetratricopeptide repeat protein [Bacteroidia bacterium]|nr:tetratricopeptide repeat protein [Bacteroidia bacterium]
MFDPFSPIRPFKFLKNHLFFLFVLSYSFGTAQIDSLTRVYSKTKTDTSRVNLINRIVYAYEQINLDSAGKWAQKGFALSKSSLNNKGIGYYFNHKGRMCLYTQKYDSAIIYFKQAYPFFEKANFTKGMISCNNNIGAVYGEIGKNKESLEYHFKNVKLGESAGDKESIANSYVNIGNVYNQMQNYYLSVQHILKAIPLYEELKLEKPLGTCYYNLAVSNYHLKNYEKASEYGLRSNEYFQRSNTLSQIPNNYSLLSNIALDQKNFDGALVAAKTGAELALKLSNTYALFFLYENMAQAYRNKNQSDSALHYINKTVNIALQFNYDPFKLKSYRSKGLILHNRKDYKNAILYLDTAQLLAQNARDLGVQSDCEQYLALCYKALSQPDKAFDHLYSSFTLKDTLFQNSNARSILELQTLFETEKKELQIKNQSLLLDSAKHKNEAKNRLLYFAAFASLCIAIFAFIAYKNFRETKKANVLISEQKKEVEFKNAEITRQKHIVDQKQKEILDSIQYAKHIQLAILPPLELVNKHFPNNFILYQPKDIVAGDFYWAEHITDSKQNLFFIAAADSTGHGVPGAIVSVVCSNALNRSVKEYHLTQPSLILDKTRELVLDTFSKSGEDVKDGMDVSLMVFDLKNKTIAWSGANNPLWYIQNGVFHEIKADKQPIGKSEKFKPFTNHVIPYVEGSLFYLFTDGYPDQFGGPEGKKFKYNRFADLLVSSHHMDMRTQAQHIGTTFSNWKNKQDQTDDVCVIGIRI